MPDELLLLLEKVEKEKSATPTPAPATPYVSGACHVFEHRADI
jgi:hypothetical protein